jgi:hypothetical protein
VAEAWKKTIIKKITTHWYRRGFILPLSELTNSYHCPSEFQVKSVHSCRQPAKAVATSLGLPPQGLAGVAFFFNAELKLFFASS